MIMHMSMTHLMHLIQSRSSTSNDTILIQLQMLQISKEFFELTQET